ncbi:hypothetical protein HII31_12903 [Pseudocercospora fuligena]|uniref:Uncharacterized protein n=1 Tax=Pseudocercospora fuligena TaxID=685502 RepID=A0A8H6R753_9PEZI|nr:hypothetical protein HII31_12903 [Pseudocercospora fuligena]
MKTTYLGLLAAAAAGLALAAPPVARDEWPITLPWPTAAPIPTSDPNWQPADNQVCLYLTNDYFWQGYGVNLCITNDQCSPKVPDSLNANISSAGPNENEVCYLYSEIDCAGTASAPITNPGYDNLGKIGFDKLARSWKCWRTDNVTASSSTSSSFRVPPSPFPTATSSSTTESRVTIVVTLPATSTTTISISSTTTESATLTTSSTDGSSPPTTAEANTTSIYSTATGFGTQIAPRVVTHTYVNGSTVVTTLMKRDVSTTVKEKYICTTLYSLETYVPTGSTSVLMTSWYTMWYQCAGHSTLTSRVEYASTIADVN